MKEPNRIKLTDSPTNKKVNLIPLPSKFDEEFEITEQHILDKTNEDHRKDNSESISKLESM